MQKIFLVGVRFNIHSPGTGGLHSPEDGNHAAGHLIKFKWVQDNAYIKLVPIIADQNNISSQRAISCTQFKS